MNSSRAGHVIARTAALAACLLLAVSLGAQQPRTARIGGLLAPRPDSLIVSLLTIGPGPALFDRFGHTAVRVRRPLSGLDSAWNWGMYSFSEPNFIFRFLTGETQYWMAGYSTPFFVNHYREQKRAVWEQELAMDQQAADSLLRFLRWNAREENKFYRYDYYLDNCSTRARDALDLALRGALKSALAGAPADSSVTWRKETLRFSGAFPYIAFGMTFALGPRADRVVTPWEEGFIPARLRDQLRTVRVPDLAGTHPLVRAERVLVPEGPFVDATASPSYAAVAGLTGLALGVLVLLAGRAGATNGAARFLVASGGAAWHVVIGIAGTLVLLAGLFTRHEFMSANASVLLGTPVSIALAWFYVRAWLPGANERTRRAAIALSSMAAAGAVVALAARSFASSMAPADWAPVFFVAPVHIAFLLALVGYERRRPAPTAPA